jgi:hypothetical protein
MGRERPLDALGTASELRDIIRRISEREVRRYHPNPTYAVVTELDRLNFTAKVQFPGASDSVLVHMGSVQPSDLGQKVRVAPISGDMFIEDVIGPALVIGALTNITVEESTGGGSGGSGGGKGDKGDKGDPGADGMGVEVLTPEETPLAIGRSLIFRISS